MSLNSLESKTSPHSWHSTNSASSSRATTRTRGCLQTCSMLILWGGNLAGWIVLIIREISCPVRLILASVEAMSSVYLWPAHYDEVCREAVVSGKLPVFSVMEFTSPPTRPSLEAWKTYVSRYAGWAFAPKCQP